METEKNKFEIIHDVVSKENNMLNISMLCDIAGVSRSGYYRWVNAAEHREKQELNDRADFEIILKAYNHRGYSKGAKGIYMHLIHQEEPIVMNLKKIRRLMKKYNLICPIRKANPYRRMAKALKTSNVAENLVNREFTKYGPRKILLTDITYIPYNGKFCYLSTILDACTKQILAYVLSDSLEVDFVLETVNILIEKHGVDITTETIIHSDQGCHYTSCSFIQLLKDKKLRQSMSRKGKIDLSNCKTFGEVKKIIDDWMDYYNNERYQWNLAKLSPNEYYEYIKTGIYPLK